MLSEINLALAMALRFGVCRFWRPEHRPESFGSSNDGFKVGRINISSRLVRTRSLPSCHDILYVISLL